MIQIERVHCAKRVAQVAAMIDAAPRTEVPFCGADFARWSVLNLDSSRVLVAIGLVDSVPAGFFIAFGPWELEKDVWVFWAYIVPKYRATLLVQKGIGFLKAWARSFGPRTEIKFETNRPRACRRLFQISSVRSKVTVEV